MQAFLLRPRPTRTLRRPHPDRCQVPASSITALLQRVQLGQPGAYDAVLPLVYDELRRMAARSLQHEAEGHTLQPTALVHEAYLRLIDQRDATFENRGHFYAIAATVMRRILVDHARRGRAEKRGGDNVVRLRDGMDAAAQESEQLLEVDAALEQLAALDARQAKVVELRYFGGLSVEQTAQVLGVSERTVKRDWVIARAFLQRALTAD